MQETAETPLMRQYLEVKRQHPEALLLFRLGDFYELFFDDARVAARELEITLTARNKERGRPVPMCGVPYHAAENYIARLIQKGFKVAVCDQMEDPRLAKKLVRREVTRVVTPGTAALAAEPQATRYLAAVARETGAVGLAVLELATGEFHATECAGPEAEARAREELERWGPKEILYGTSAPLFEAAGRAPGAASGISWPAGAALTPLEDWIFAADFALHELESHFGVLSLEAYGLAGHPLAGRAAGALVHYVKETQRSQIAHVDRIGFYARQDALVLDAATARTLELVEPAAPGEGAATTLYAALDLTLTPMGRRLLRAWLLRPSIARETITARWDAVGALAAAGPRAALRLSLEGILDLERLLGRASLATASPRDLEALRLSLDRLPGVRQALAGPAGTAAAGRLAPLAAELDDLPELRARLAATLAENPPAAAEGGYVRPGFSPELDRLRDLAHDARRVVAALEARERGRTGIGSLKVRFNNVFGYYLEVSRPNLALVPSDYERKQTLANAERFTTPELKQLEVQILSAEEKAQTLEAAIFAALRAEVVAAAGPVRRAARAIGELDLLANFAELAAQRGYVRPEWSEGELEIRGGRHPVVERMVAAGSRFVPNDTYLDERRRVAIVTGPNMGGKSTYLRQVALIAIMAQMGSFVPAERARLAPFDRIFTRIGAGDNLARGRSTFLVEMIETAVILHAATPHSLVVLDEIGRGTATYDGLALAWAAVEHLHGVNGAPTLVATHFHELTALADQLDGVLNLHVAAQDSPAGIVFLRRVEPGPADRSYGIEVAKLAGLPPEVIARARAVLASHERAERRASDDLETPAARSQLTLFTPLGQQIVSRLAALDLDRTTPLEAINLLAALQRQLESE